MWEPPEAEGQDHDPGRDWERWSLVWPGCGLGSREEEKHGVRETGAHLCCPDPYDGKTIPRPGLSQGRPRLMILPKYPGREAHAVLRDHVCPGALLSPPLAAS